MTSMRRLLVTTTVSVLRGRPLADAGVAKGRGGDRLYHRVDHAVADRRVHPAVPDGRICRAFVPRICDHCRRVTGSVAGDLADAHADDVLAPAKAGYQSAWPAPPPVRARICRPAQPLRARAQ